MPVKVCKNAAARYIIYSLRCLLVIGREVEYRDLVKRALDLCLASASHDYLHLGPCSDCEEVVEPEDLVALLENLKNRAEAAGMEDFEMILGATHRLCYLTYYFSKKGKLRMIV